MQSALTVPKLGAPLVRITRPIPTPKGNQLLVKVEVAGCISRTSISDSSEPT